MNETTNLNIRMDKNLKKQAEELFAEFGINMTTAINMFLKQSVRQRGIPFELTLNTPNAETIAAMQEAEDMMNGKIPKNTMSVADFIKEMEQD